MFLAWLPQIFLVHAQRFVEISAEIEMVNYSFFSSNHTLVEAKRSFPLKCIVSTNEWRIDTEFSLNGREAFYFDGTNVFSSLQMTKEVPKPYDTPIPGAPAKVPFAIAASNITVTITPSPGGHPLGNMGINLPWLAFCSGSYLRREGRDIPLPVARNREDPDCFAYSDRTELFPDELGLPEHVELYTCQTRRNISANDPRLLRTERVEHARHYPVRQLADGILKFRYRVERSTNFNGWHLPLDFTYRQFDLDKQGNTKLHYEGTGKVISIRQGSPPTNVLRSNSVGVNP
jgi:hypothetical protein